MLFASSKIILLTLTILSVTETMADASANSSAPDRKTSSTKCPVINSCMEASNPIAQNATDSLGDGLVEASIAQCYLKELANADVCFKVPNDFNGLHRSFDCVADPTGDGRYVCWRDYVFDDSTAPANDASPCKQQLPSQLTQFQVTFLSMVNEKTELLDLSPNMPCATKRCAITNGVASCPIAK